MKYIKYIAITILLIVPLTGFAAPSTTYLTNSVIISTTTPGCTGISSRGELYSTGVNCGTGGGGGGSAGGTWSTTTSSVLGQLINYSNNTTDIVTVGSTATTSAGFYLNPNTGSAVFSSTLPEPMSNLALEENYQLSLVKPVSILASTTGIGFGISGSGRNNIGGVMLYARTGSSSKGEFRWYTKGTQTSGASPTFGMVLTDTQRLGIGTSTPYAMLSVVGEVVGQYFTATSTTATSTFANGINLTGGCFAVNGSCFTGSGGGSSGPVTTTFEFNSVEPQTDSFDFAPGGGYIQPIYGPTFTNATSSAMYYDIPIPQNVSATPNALLIPWLSATGTPSTGIAVMEFYATTTGPSQNWYTTKFTDIHTSSTTAANRFALATGTSLPITSTTTISLAGLNLTAGSVLKVRVVRYGADANDTVDNDVFMPKLLLQIDTN